MTHSLRQPFRYLLVCGLLLCTSLVQAQVPITSDNDPRGYRFLALDNGLRVLLINDPTSDKSAASMNVKVGSAQDPSTHAGLAHFLEHMLFLGTEKYPQADEYQAFISEHGGSHNAFTAQDKTNYFFDIDPRYLEAALDRFSQFFIAPLFTAKYVDRERHAVHSEYQSKFKEDGRRGYSVLKQVMAPNHPLAGFSVGSLETLQDRPGKPLRQALIDFYQRYYSSHRMTAALIGPQPLDELERLARNAFTAIDRRAAPLAQAKLPLFADGTLPQTLKIATIKDQKNLSLSFPIPAQQHLYRSKPAHYVTAILGDEGEGSLLSLLKQQGLATGLSAGVGFGDEYQQLLDVSIDLTEAGYTRYPEIIDHFFQTVRLIRQQGVQERLFREQQQIADMRFRFREPSKATYYAMRLAGNLDEYPVEDLIRGDYLLFDFEPAQITTVINQLRPENMLITLSAPDITGNQRDPWFDTDYSLTPVAEHQLAQWRQGPVNSALRLPPPNPYLASDFSLRTGASSAVPSSISVMPGLRLWHQRDSEFSTPKADFFFNFRSPLANDSVRHHLLTRLYIALVNESLNRETYPAHVAGLDSRLYPHMRGFSARVSGFSGKQGVLLRNLVQGLRDFAPAPEGFAIEMRKLKQELENSLKDKPYHQTLEQVYQQVLVGQWSTQEQLAELETLTVNDLLAFWPQLYKNGEIEALAHGNLNNEDAIRLAEELRPLLNNTRVVAVPHRGIKLLASAAAEIALDVDHNDTAVTLYYQAQQAGNTMRANYGLLNQILSASFYNQLRTEQQLGYIVFSSAMPIMEHPGLIFVVQSPSTPAAKLVAAIEEFIGESHARIAAITEQELAQHKQSLLIKLLKKDQKLNERSQRYWKEIDNGHTEFNSREQLAEAIRNVTLKDLQDTIRTLNSKKLTVLAPGHSQPDQAPILEARLKPAA